METFSHLQPINRIGHEGWSDAHMLTEAFSNFVSASARLEVSYGQLQLEVTFLSRELAARNTALRNSLAENESVHRALQASVDAMPCGVMVVEVDRSVSMINPEARRLLDIEGSPALHLDAISRASGIDLSGFLSAAPDHAGEQEFVKGAADGKRWLAVSMRCLPCDCGDLRTEIRQTIVIVRDVTQQKLTEVARQQSSKVEALADVALTLAHEIRNPLASLELFTGLVAAGGQDQATWISHLHAGIRSLSATVSNVLSFHGRETSPLGPLDLIAAIRSSVEFAIPIARQAGIALSLECDDAGLWINGSASALQQVVLNMVCNALKHSVTGGAVWISVSREKTSPDTPHGFATIEFSDNGTGIPAEFLSEIFKPGFSVEGKSTGLGLAVCSQIVGQHGGTIRVLSRRGMGTTFYVEVPAL